MPLPSSAPPIRRQDSGRQDSERQDSGRQDSGWSRSSRAPRHRSRSPSTAASGWRRTSVHGRCAAWTGCRGPSPAWSGAVPCADSWPRSASMTDPRVIVLVRPGCHLCGDAKAVIAAVCAEESVDWAERDITGDAELTERYTDEIPVTFVDGKQHDYWRVNPDRLRAALRRPAG